MDATQRSMVSFGVGAAGGGVLWGLTLEPKVAVNFKLGAVGAVSLGLGALATSVVRSNGGDGWTQFAAAAGTSTAAALIGTTLLSKGKPSPLQLMAAVGVGVMNGAISVGVGNAFN